MADETGQGAPGADFEEILKAVAGEHEEQVRATTRMILQEPFSTAIVVRAVLHRDRRARWPRSGWPSSLVTLGAGRALRHHLLRPGHHRPLRPRMPGVSADSTANSPAAYLGEEIEEPEPFIPARASWVGCSRRCGTGSVGGPWPTSLIKVPLASSGVFIGFAFWWDAFFCITFPVWGGGSGKPRPSSDCPGSSSAATLFNRYHSGFLHQRRRLPGRHVLLLRRPVGHPGRRLSRPPGHAGAPGPRPVGRAGALARARPSPDGRLLGRHTAADRARPPRRHPGPAGGAGHAARHGQGEAGRDPDTCPTWSRSASWSTTPTRAPRRPSSNCATWPEASTRRRSTSGSKARWPPWPPAAPSPPSSPSRLARSPDAGHRGHRLLLRGRVAGQRGPARRGVTGHRRSAPSRATGCGWSCGTTARVAPNSPCWASRPAAWSVSPIGSMPWTAASTSPAHQRGPTVVTVDLPLHA